MAQLRVQATDLEQLVSDIFRAAGMGRNQAELMAQTLVYADLRGVQSHGVIRVADYLRRAEAGVMRLDAEPKLERVSGASALFDAKQGPGQVAAHAAMKLAVELAATHGVGVVGVHNSNHFGVAAYFAAQAAASGCIGLVLTNAAPAMLPHNGTRPLLGTNPLAIAVPVPEGEPLVLDMATSQVARGRIRKAALTGETIPTGWGVDAEGNPTTDARAALAGSVCPMGGPKGAGLSLMIDLLCGALMGGIPTGEVRAITDVTGPAQTGHLLMAIDPAAFGGREHLATTVARVMNIYADMPALDQSRVRLPGEIENETARALREQGLLLPEKVLQALTEAAGRWNVTVPWATRP